MITFLYIFSMRTPALYGVHSVTIDAFLIE